MAKTDLELYLQKAFEAEALAMRFEEGWLKTQWLDIAKEYRQLAEGLSQPIAIMEQQSQQAAAKRAGHE